MSSNSIKYDIVFISFDEENADENWDKLKSSYPNAKRVHRVEGIHEAHRKAYELAETDFFFTIDGDNQIINNPFITMPDNLSDQAVYVWRAINGVNGLVYGYGGIKLWPRNLFSKSPRLSQFTDHATEITPDYRVVPVIGSKTLFNTSPYSSWKSGFREAFKLARNATERNDERAREWLKTWTSIGLHADHGSWCILGALEGICSYLKVENGETASINSFTCLQDAFRKRSQQSPIHMIRALQDLPSLRDYCAPLEEPSESLSKTIGFTKRFRLSR